MRLGLWNGILPILWLTGVCCGPAICAPRSGGDGFVSLFDGKTLSGWNVEPKTKASDWTVRDGVIVGRGDKGHSYLAWKDKGLADFELKLSYRLPTGKGNTGIDIRGRPVKSGRRRYESYHADLGHVGIGPHILGAWDFHFTKRKEHPCNRGTRLVIDANEKGSSSKISGALTKADIHPRQWNNVRVIARGNHFQFFINGKIASEFTDNAKQGRLDKGVIRLQIHDRGMLVEFKDIRLKRLASTARPMPTVDISKETNRQVLIAAGTKSIYQGHPHTLLLADGKTMFCVWTLIHGHGAPRMKRSDDGGKTWSKLLALPEGWAPYGHCPTLHRIIAADKKEHLLLMDRTGRTNVFSQAISRDNGKTWGAMKSTGLKGVVAPISIVAVDGGKKHLMWSHRGAGDRDRSPLTLWQAESTDAALTWKNYRKVCEVPGKDPCEPAVIRSPDGKQLLMLIRDNKHKSNSLMMTSDDEGKTWSKPTETSWGLTGDRHCPKYAPDGRLVVVFRDVAQPCPPRGHFVAWVGRYEDIIKGREGQYRIKLMHHYGRAGDCGYPGLELLPDGTFAATTYIKHKPGPEKHSVVSVRFKLDEIDKKRKPRK
ncbi:MAG: DUF1080 domain-containing protein [Phycisphaerae bacterium]|jgi:hypothetical protein|nr:DUF1080 domain-containing protein [Phycisphaerae bacterium]